jgi:two-component system OmpR family response regulator
MRHAGEVVTRTMLAEHVWGDHFDSLSNLIEVFVTRGRQSEYAVARGNVQPG